MKSVSNTIKERKADILVQLEKTNNENLINAVRFIVRDFSEQDNAAFDKKKMASEILADEIFSLNRDLEKARYILHEMQEEFFYKINPENEEDGRKVLCEFDRHRVFCDIVSNSVLGIRKTIENITGKVNERGQA